MRKLLFLFPQFQFLNIAFILLHCSTRNTASNESQKYDGIIQEENNFLDKCPVLNSIALEYINAGDEYASVNYIQYAIHYYSAAEKMAPKNMDILERIAEGYIYLEYFYRALGVAEDMLNLEQFSAPGVFYKSKALMGLQRFKEAIHFLTKKMSSNENMRKDIYLLNLLKILQKLDYQSRTGIYDIMQLYQHSWLPQDLADYTGSVKIKKIPGKGRGLVATEDIVAGQLLLVNKAFAISYQEDPNDVHWFGYDELVAKVVDKLDIEPEHANWFYKSYAGPDVGWINDWETKMGNNSVDYRRIEGVCAYTSTHGGMNPLWPAAMIRRGVWVLPAYINHNCMNSNSFWVAYGDLMVVRAFRNISQGQEILVSYLDPAEPFDERDFQCQRHGFECNCSLCKVDRNDSNEVRDERTRIIQEIELFQGHPKDLEPQINKLEQLRPNNPELNVYIARPLWIMGYSYFDRGHFRKAANAFRKAHDVIKNSSFPIILIEYSTFLLNSYISLGNREEIRYGINLVKQDLINAFGSIDVFKIIGYNSILALDRLKIDFFAN